MEGDAQLGELLRCQMASQGAAHAGHDGRQNRASILNRDLSEHHAHYGLVPVPAGHICVSGVRVENGQYLAKRIASLFGR